MFCIKPYSWKDKQIIDWLYPSPLNYLIDDMIKYLILK